MCFFSYKGYVDIYYGPSGTCRVAIPEKQDVSTKFVYMSSSCINGPKRGERKTYRFPTARERVTIFIRNLAT